MRNLMTASKTPEHARVLIPNCRRVTQERMALENAMYECARKESTFRLSSICMSCPCSI